MYAQRYAARRGVNPASLGIAIGINAALVAGLMFANPEVVRRIYSPPIDTYNVPEPPLPEPVKPLDPPKTKATPHETPLTSPDPVVHTTVPNDFPIPPLPPQPYVPVDPGPGTGAGTGVTVDPPKPVPPVLTQPGIDPRYAGLFQPPYPPAQERAGATGKVVVRVLIGVDGRVKQVERVLATNDDFFRVTEQRALGKWRFKPATRDGVPVEGWRTMTVRFTLKAD